MKIQRIIPYHLIQTVAILLLIPSVTIADHYYDTLTKGPNVFDYYSPSDHNTRKGITLYKMRIEKSSDGNLFDTISEMHVETTGACIRTNTVSNAVLMVKKQNNRQLFLENGNICGVKDIFK